MNHTGTISLDPRLSAIAGLVGKCSCFADIGCDHGRLGAFLLQSGQCERAQMTDVSERSLNKARALIERLDLSRRVDFCVGDGAEALCGPVQAAVIAGMGGTTIAGIIRQGRRKLADARLVLQPNVAAPELREALCECGYAVTDELVARDGRRNYIVIKAEPGASAYSRRQLVVGPVLLERMPPELMPYAQFRLRVAKKALMGASASSDGEQADMLAAEIRIWEEVCACLRR